MRSLVIMVVIMLSWQCAVASFSTAGACAVKKCVQHRTTTRSNIAGTVIQAHPGDESDATIMRRSGFLRAGSTIIAAFLTTGRSENSLAIPSYSSNARNLGRLASGDSSGGSIYDNFPKTDASKKRRAMTGCKIPSARREAARREDGSLTEKDCNLRVMSGDSDFMLEAMRALDCPTCPYGVDPK